MTKPYAMHRGVFRSGVRCSGQPRLASRSARTLAAAALLIAFVAVATGCAVGVEPPGARLAYERNTIDVVRAAGPSVVSVRASSAGEAAEDGEDSPSGGQRIAGGSGFVVDESGLIITNFHVVAMAIGDATDDYVHLAPGATLTVSYLGSAEIEHPVRVVGANPDVDLALLALLDPGRAPSVPPIPLADSDRALVGQKAIAIGNPFGLHSSVTAGIISAVERNQPGLVGIDIPYIQTDAAINPGNSGGPLLDSAGRVVGINNTILAPSGAFAGVGLAVPSNLLREAMQELRAGGLSGLAAAAAQLPDRPRLGLQIGLRLADYPRALREQLGLPARGVVVTGVSTGGPADRAGIRGPDGAVLFEGQLYPVGMDVITAIEGEPVARAIDVQRVVLQRAAGDVVTLTIWRDGSELQLGIALEVVPVED
jgi:serine protease Do